MQALERLELICDTGAEGADGDITDISEEVLNADFFGFLGFDCGGGVDKSFGGCGAVLVFWY